MTRIVMVRGRSYPRNRPYTFAGLSLLMAVVAGINLGIGLSMDCSYTHGFDSNCDYRRNAYIISGSCFVVSSVCFLISAVAMHLRIKKAMRDQQSMPEQQTVTVSPEYTAHRVVSFPVVQTQYPPPYVPATGPTPYPPPTGPTPYPPQAGPTPYPPQAGPTPYPASAGFTPYPLSPVSPNNQNQQQIGFAVDPEPNQVTQPPPYSP